MFIHRAVLTLAVVIATATLDAQNLIRNGGFTEAAPRVGAGNIPPNQVSGWTGAYQTPQLIVGDGCRDANFIAMWGNKVVGEAIAQTVALRQGTTYDVEICARYRSSTSTPFAHVELRASTAPLTAPGCPAGTCEAMEGAKKVTATTWTPYRFQFTPARDYAHLTISTTNDSSVNDGAQVSWAEIDNVSITARPSDNLAPLINAKTRASIPDQYMVIFKPTATRADVDAAEAAVKSLGGTVLFRYTAVIRGLGFKLPPGTSVQPLRALRNVAYVAVDQKVKAIVQQTPAPDGLDRIDRRLLTPPLDDQFTYSETGAGVNAYVIDTGILATHNEFAGGRAHAVFTSILDGNGMNDCDGHGTHVAGTLGGTTYGVAKQVTLFGVRVLDCNGDGTEAGVVAGVDWVANNAVAPAVANMSLAADPGVALPTLETWVTNSIAAGITYVIAAGNNNADACTVSPARVPAAITVGATVPASDIRASFSNWGTCVDLFAPGFGIESSWIPLATSTKIENGTSMAAPHVAGAVALYLQENPAGTPASALARVHANANVFPATQNWPGIPNRGPGSPNELLHWGSRDDGYTDGDPHLTTIGGTRYDFQAAGEFVLLRGGGLEIQVRQTPVATTSGPCVSVNTAVAARVGTNRISYQPNLSGNPDPSGLQLRVDGVVTSVGTPGLNLPGGGRIAAAPVGGGIEVHFPDGTVLFVTPGWWEAQKLWFLNVHVARTRATEGIIGRVAPGNWLPALSNGKLLGPPPGTPQQRYTDLYRIFADAWRVTPATSLFDYGARTSTDTFTNRNWPPASGSCSLPNSTPAQSAEPAVAKKACDGLAGDLRADCVFDVTVTGETAFAKAYLLAQQIRRGATRIAIADPVDPTSPNEPAVITATVAAMKADKPGGRSRVAGSVQFFVDGKRFGEPVRLDDAGIARSRMSLGIGVHRLSATFTPEGSVYLPSSSVEEPHTVGRIGIP